MDVDAAAEVDRAVSGYLGMLPWPRFLKILDAAILTADPTGAAERAHRAKTERDVFAYDSEDGLKTLIAKAGSGDITWFMATVNRIADILSLDGDPDPIGARRAKAIGLLAQPARALHLLITHTSDPDRPHHPNPDQRHSDQTAADEAHQPAPADTDLPEPDTPDTPDDASTPTPPEPVEDPTETPPELVEGPRRGRPPHTRQEPDTARPPDNPTPAGATSPSTSSDNNDNTANTDEPPNGLDLTPPATPLDPAAARPRIVLHFHLSDYTLHYGRGPVRPEHGPALTLTELHDFLTDTGCQIRVEPVLDPSAVAPVDAYETPLRLRDALLTRNPTDVFPYGTTTSRSIDLDHTIPYLPLDQGGPPGQTGLHNLGPHARPHHRAVTHGHWQRRQPHPDTYLHRSPHGYIYLTTNQGTLTLGHTPFAEQVWQQAAPPQRGPGSP